MPRISKLLFLVDPHRIRRRFAAAEKRIFDQLRAENPLFTVDTNVFAAAFHPTITTAMSAIVELIKFTASSDLPAALLPVLKSAGNADGHLKYVMRA